MYNKKSKDPSIEPCGTPAKIGDQLEDWPLKTTLWNWGDHWGNFEKVCES